MSDDHSDGEGDGGHKADPVDMTEDMDIELNLPREVDEEQGYVKLWASEGPGLDSVLSKRAQSRERCCIYQS